MRLRKDLRTLALEFGKVRNGPGPRAPDAANKKMAVVKAQETPGEHQRWQMDVPPQNGIAIGCATHGQMRKRAQRTRSLSCGPELYSRLCWDHCGK